MALATTTTPGSVILGGDLTGVANAPELRVTGVVAGSYHLPTIVVDAKGRLIYAAITSSLYYLTGELTGYYATTSLSDTGVNAGSYTNASFTVSAGGRISVVTDGNMSGDLLGQVSNNRLSDTGVNAGSYTNASFTVSAGGRITACIANSTTLGGDFTSNLSNAALISQSGVSPGTYSAGSITVNSKGIITAVSNPTYPTASYSVSGLVQIASLHGLTIASGVLSGTLATNTVSGMVKSSNTSNITITSGAVNIGGNIPTFVTNNTFSRAQVGVHSSYSSSFTPDLTLSNWIVINPAGTTIINSPTNMADGRTFAITASSVNSLSYITSTTATITPSCRIIWNGSYFFTVGNNRYVCQSSDGLSWAIASDLGVTFTQTDICWSGSTFCIIGYTGTVNYSATSTDGVNWSIVSSSAVRAGVICWSVDRFVVAYGNAIKTSPDGVSWTTRSTTVPASIQAIAAAGGGIVVQLTGYSYYSTNGGVSWTTVSNSLGGLGRYSFTGAVVSSTTIFVQHEYNGFSYSTNFGASWTSVSSTGFQGGNVLYDGTIFAAFGNAVGGGSSPRMSWSSNGSDWSSPIASSAFGDDAGTNGSYFVGYGNGPTSILSFSKFAVNKLAFSSTYKFSNTNLSSSVAVKCTCVGSSVYATYLN